MATVLVTGASGFIGGHLVEALVRRGDRVRCLVRPSSRTELLQAMDVELLRGELSDPQGLRRAIAGTDVVYHVAGLTTARHARELRRVNAEGVAQLQAACAAQVTPPVHVLVSSVAAAGPAARGRLRYEHDQPAPISTYGKSKRAGEMMAARWAREVPTTVVRPGVVFGPRNRELLGAFRSIRRYRIHVVPSWSPPRLSFIYVTDLAEILIRAAERGDRLRPQRRAGPPTQSDLSVRHDDSLPWEAGIRATEQHADRLTHSTTAAENGPGCYFACDDEHPTYAQLGRMMANALDQHHVLLLGIADPLAFFVAGIFQLANAARGRSGHVCIDKMRDAVVDSWACSPDAARKALDFQPPLPLATRLRESVAWYRQHGWL